MLIRISPAELLTLATAAGFYLSPAIEAVSASGHSLFLRVAPHGLVPGVPGFLRNLLPVSANVELEFLGYDDGVAAFQTRIDGPRQLGALLPQAANALAADLLDGNDLSEDAMNVDSNGVMHIEPAALLENFHSGITVKNVAVEDGEWVIQAQVQAS